MMLIGGIASNRPIDIGRFFINKTPGGSGMYNKVNSDSYCKYLQDQLINYLTKKSLFNDEDKDNV